ncbi:MAG: DNA polymerase I, partial [Clostridia bacterium]|nr:DNA polymerase I [Clostridia bacterium]
HIADIMPLIDDVWIQKIVFDAKPLYAELLTQNKAPGEAYYDVMVAQYVLDSTMSGYSAKNISMRILQRETDSVDEFVAAMPEMYRWQQQMLEERNQRDLLYNIELPLTMVLADMELVGFKVDRDRLLQYSDKIAEAVVALERQIYDLAEEEFNINSPKQLGSILFEKLQLKPAKKTKSGFSTNADALEKVRNAHPIVELVLEYRKYAKLKSTYCDGLLGLLDAESKIHTSFQQTVTHTGRISSTEPNLQNIPVRTEIGRELRAMFVASDEDKILVDADYSQIELRVLAHIADDENMIRGFEQGTDIHTATASRVFNVPLEEVTTEMRRAAKAVNFGIVYGISDFSLAQDIHVSKKEAKAYIENYLNEYSGVKRYMEETVAFGKENGFVGTIFGRRRELPELSSGNFIMRSFGERVAMNTPIQGSAADIIKIAMVNTFRRLKAEELEAKLILQVHDELIIEAPRREQEKVCRLLAEEMENAANLKVKLVADVHCGESWYDCK